MLETKQVGEYVVSQAGMREAVRRVSMLNKLQETAENYDDETLTALAIYPHIAGCVTPIISIDEFIQIPEQVLDELSTAAMELNPHWFIVPEQEKKTKRPRKTSTQNLPT
jgi:hypothetical protein